VPNNPATLLYGKAPLVGAFCLFLPSLLLGQARILHPSPQEELTSQQIFDIAVEGETTRVELFLNGALVAARSKPPFRFEIRWNVLSDNLIELRLRRPDGHEERLQQRYPAPVIDLQERVAITDWFPYSFRPLSEEELASLSAHQENGSQLSLKAGPATQFPQALLFLVDVSGSMKPLRDEALQFLAPLQSAGEQSALVVFDGAASRVESLKDLQQLEPLFGRHPASAIYDALRQSLAEFPARPRRMLLLVSDGYDDSSTTRPDQLEADLARAGVMLFWYSPTALDNRALRQLCIRSGGQAWQGPAAPAAAEFLAILEHQFHLRLEQKGAPIRLGPAKLDLQYPRW
jgi:hypothetical protein